MLNWSKVVCYICTSIRYWVKYLFIFALNDRWILWARKKKKDLDQTPINTPAVITQENCVCALLRQCWTSKLFCKLWWKFTIDSLSNFTIQLTFFIQISLNLQVSVSCFCDLVVLSSCSLTTWFHQWNICDYY